MLVSPHATRPLHPFLPLLQTSLTLLSRSDVPLTSNTASLSVTSHGRRCLFSGKVFIMQSWLAEIFNNCQLPLLCLLSSGITDMMLTWQSYMGFVINT